jgi:hypothetical protein
LAALAPSRTLVNVLAGLQVALYLQGSVSEDRSCGPSLRLGGLGGVTNEGFVVKFHDPLLENGLVKALSRCPDQRSAREHVRIVNGFSDGKMVKKKKNSAEHN